MSTRTVWESDRSDSSSSGAASGAAVPPSSAVRAGAVSLRSELTRASGASAATAASLSVEP